MTRRWGSAKALDDVSVTLRPGAITAVLGPSGCGKTTLLRTLLLLDVPDAGAVIVDGRPIELRERRGARVVADRAAQRRLRQRCGVAFQGDALWAHMTILENVIEAPVAVHRVPKRDAIARAEAWLDRLGIADHRGRYPRELSGGEQQRAAIARALAVSPDMLLLDEPTSALDPGWRERIAVLLSEQAAAGRAILLVTHDLQLARTVSTTVLCLSGGRVIDEGPPELVLDPELRGAAAAVVDAIDREQAR